MLTTRNPDAPLTTSLALLDDTLTVLSEGPTVRECALAIRIEGQVHDIAGPAQHALYAQALHAVTHDTTIASLVSDLSEGHAGASGPEPALAVEENREWATGDLAGFVLTLTATYDERAAGPPKRAAILAAVQAALDASTPLPDPPLCETTLAALFALVQAAAPTAERNAPQPVDDAAAWRFYDGDMTADHGTFGITLYRRSFALERFVPGADVDAIDADVQAMMAVFRGAGRLGGLAFDTEVEGLDPETLADRYVGPMLAARIAGVVTFLTTANEPTEVAA